MLRLTVFGPPQLSDPSRDLSGAARQRKPLALLALLAWAGERGLTRDSVVGYLWPDLDETHAKGALKQLLYSIRRDAAPELVAGSGILRLNAAVCRCDLLEYREALAAGRLDEAQAIQQRPFLDGFYLSDSGEFDSWVATERASFESALRHALGKAVTRTETRRAGAEPPPRSPAPEPQAPAPAPAPRSSRMTRGLATLSAVVLGLVASDQPLVPRSLLAARSPEPSTVRQPERTYSTAAPDFGTARLVVRVADLRARDDSLIATIQLSNPGEELLRLGSISLVLGTDSAGARYRTGSLAIGARTALTLADLPARATSHVVVARPVPGSRPILRRLRCGQPLFYQVSLVLFDENLRPGTVDLTIGTLRREASGLFLRSYSFRYFMEDGRTELESRGYRPQGASPKYLGEMAKRMLAPAVDSACAVS